MERTTTESITQSVVPSSSKQVKFAHTSFHASSTVLLKTAVIDVINHEGVKTSLMVLLDDGGEGCLIREGTMQRLGLKKQRAKVTVTGVGDLPAMKSRWIVHTTLYSQVDNTSFDVACYAVQKVTGTINKVQPGEPRSWTHIKGLRLADPHFFEGGEIDMLLGSDVVPYLLRGGLKKLNSNSPVAQETIFGWVLFGKVGQTNHSSFKVNTIRCEISEQLRRFWEIEEVPTSQPLTLQESICENHFVSTHTRTKKGRYVVRLPFNEKKKDLGKSRAQAIRRLHALERRFARNPKHKEAYVNFMREYQALGHMEEIPSTEVDHTETNTYYLPHHFVLKEDSTTTKLRVVFDGSAKTTTGISLNDALHVGPTVQPDLFTLLIKFRYDPIAFKADIRKMYRQFQIHHDDQGYLLIVWREDSSKPERTFRLKTVTYGTGPASFLATRCLNQLAEDEGEKYPLAAVVILLCMYVDDLLGTCQSVEEAKEIVKQLISIMESAGMEICKWCTNSAALLESIPPSLREESTFHEISDSASPESVKALGIKWQPSTDEFVYTTVIPEISMLTKRVVLSEISKTFDPLGWLTPVTINAKLIMQRTWIEGQDWDEELQQQLKDDWSKYVEDMKMVSSIHIPRCVISSTPTLLEVHGFCDSSELAYAAAVYIKCQYNDGSTSVNLLTSRSKVAPMKCVSLPKLELCGAELLAKTMEAVLKTLKHTYTVFCWTDSTITLRWITSHSRKWKTFVANRVSTIQTIIPPCHWRHVKSQDNPADLPSRGVTCADLINSTLWWNGPSWLKDNDYPNSTASCEEQDVLKEARTKQIFNLQFTQHSAHTLLFSRFSSFSKLQRCAAYLIRFVDFITKKTVTNGPLTTTELSNAKKMLAGWSQAASFQKEIKALRKDGKVSPSSKLSTLHPFLDADGILRVGGRIQNAKLPFSTRHPIIISHDHQLSTLICEYFHRITLHGTFCETHSTIRREFWILRGPDTVRHHIKKCVTCRRAKAKTATQLMGNLPVGRVTATRAFLHVGVDYAGPFQVKFRKGRYYNIEKMYFCIYVCLSTKAVHLEAVTSLSTEAFIASYERFVSRRGIPSHIYSDCGTNFVGADRVLRDFLVQQQSHLQDTTARRGTSWMFNPPSAPHQGGLWEAGVKSVKKHFVKVVGQRTLHYEEFQTLLAKIEAVLNCRPLCALSSDPEDMDALTPSHFLIGEPLLNIPEPDLTKIPENRLKHFDTVRQLTQHFWKRWRLEYLTSLQQRFRWKQKRDNLEAGDLVVIADDLHPVSTWKLGRIIAVHSGADGLVRSATVKTRKSEFKRPITKLSPLFYSE